MMTNPNSILNEIVNISELAGNAIAEIFINQTPIEVAKKADNSPVTIADLTAHNLIVQHLTALNPHIPILSEENSIVDFDTRKQWQQYWLVDPLDGTKEFINGFPDFTVNIALIENNVSILGVINAPMKKTTYYAAKTMGCFKKHSERAPQLLQLPNQYQKKDSITIAVSRRHGEDIAEFAKQFKTVHTIPMGSSLKMCIIAEGLADVYPRIGPTSEWDTAAGQCILECAGGKILDREQNPLRYNTKDSLRNPNFIAIGNGPAQWATHLR